MLVVIKLTLVYENDNVKPYVIFNLERYLHNLQESN